ncbi:MAG TPA: DUF3306 domain-containing protein [Noviherbaspirillum sp.]|uniref:DUF3306 domain-containing protein n=1 Tax=Noviherbaspirillum sp. TaxID=1926288 RepID=UPI002F931A1D
MADNFFRRWARRKAEHLGGVHGGAPPGPEQEAGASHDTCGEALPAPGMQDVRRLRFDSDFSRFVAKGVDPGVRRAALKTLFSDPHFHAMDGLDIYIDDYTRPSPVSPEMLAALAHARTTLFPQPLYRDDADGVENQAIAGPADGAADVAGTACADAAAAPAAQGDVPAVPEPGDDLAAPEEGRGRDAPPQDARVEVRPP